ncbi:hypothetical protein OGR47_06720 [Methylocystis sp. MJC1]|jgi:hypothetical protein|uniref:hypothetical protein n=1 Tax=Methylocystis sp. MJC1 TaxID=2654282 RepID=UPI0013EAAB6E|nr:hypothetical protein [Methylocystis sp. MJC1]KAF2992730.1 hypothetical protein MJC1_00309 [Methylocystis sp. MJC1]MBU6526693.1 hypothetical protein [Methylocystis sp. MJC1]UZX13132.1 hypothetical protein OGR47_06720 [Methylocystis sp. MJC1]
MKHIELILALGAGIFFAGVAHGAGEGAGCQPGSEKCPLILKMKRGSDAISFSCVLSNAKPGCAARFEARAGQAATLQGDPIARKILVFPSGDGTDELELGPYTLPETGTYTLKLSYGASMMSRDANDRPAKYSWTLRIH